VWSSAALNNMGDGTSVQTLLQNLSEHIQEHKAVTYKWFAREYSLPANYAKQLLFRFVEEQGSKIRAVYAVSGCSKADNDQQQHIVRLVDSSQLESCRGELQEGTISMHIHRWGWPQQQQCLHVPVLLHEANVPVLLQHLKVMVRCSARPLVDHALCSCSVLPSADDSKLEPEALYAEDVEQARHFYKVCQKCCNCTHACAGQYTRPCC
jgi:hypothetical protein